MIATIAMLEVEARRYEELEARWKVTFLIGAIAFLLLAMISPESPAPVFATMIALCLASLTGMFVAGRKRDQVTKILRSRIQMVYRPTQDNR